MVKTIKHGKVKDDILHGKGKYTNYWVKLGITAFGFPVITA